MSKSKRLIVFLFCLLFFVNLTSCSKLEITPQMQESIDKYIDAVKKTINKTKGQVSVTTLLDDSAIEFKKTESVIDYSFEIIDGKVIFDRTDLVNGQQDCKYRSDGLKVEMLDKNNIWVDKTQENKDFLIPHKNPLISLSLFRIDNNLKLKTEYLTDIKGYQQEDFYVVEFTLKDSTVSDVLGFYKADGIVRESVGHTRTYFIDKEGYISKILIVSEQEFISNGEVGNYTSTMTVLCK